MKIIIAEIAKEKIEADVFDKVGQKPTITLKNGNGINKAECWLSGEKLWQCEVDANVNIGNKMLIEHRKWCECEDKI